MVKLAKKRNKVMLDFYINLPDRFRINKTGMFNFEEAYQSFKGLPRKSCQLLAAMYLLSDKDNYLQTNDELQMLAIKGFLVELDRGDGIVDTDQFRVGYKQYKGLMDSMWAAAKIMRRKEKKFGDPPYPTCDDMFDAIKELQDKGLVNDDMSLNMSKHDIAVMRQRFIREGFDLDNYNL